MNKHNNKLNHRVLLIVRNFNAEFLHITFLIFGPIQCATDRQRKWAEINNSRHQEKLNDIRGFISMFSHWVTTVQLWDIHYIMWGPYGTSNTQWGNSGKCWTTSDSIRICVFKAYYTFIISSKRNWNKKRNAKQNFCFCYLLIHNECIVLVFNVSTNNKHTQNHTVQLWNIFGTQHSVNSYRNTLQKEADELESVNASCIKDRPVNS